MRLYALVSAQGTACAETVLRSDEYTPAARARVERAAALDRSADRPVAGTWTDVTDNDYFAPLLRGKA